MACYHPPPPIISLSSPLLYTWPSFLASLLFLARCAPTSRLLPWLFILSGTHSSLREQHGRTISLLPISHLCSNVIFPWGLPFLPVLELLTNRDLRLSNNLKVYLESSRTHTLETQIQVAVLTMLWREQRKAGFTKVTIGNVILSCKWRIAGRLTGPS